MLKLLTENCTSIVDVDFGVTQYCKLSRKTGESCAMSTFCGQSKKCAISVSELQITYNTSV